MKKEEMHIGNVIEQQLAAARAALNYPGRYVRPEPARPQQAPAAVYDASLNWGGSSGPAAHPSGRGDSPMDATLRRVAGIE